MITVELDGKPVRISFKHARTPGGTLGSALGISAMTYCKFDDRIMGTALCSTLDNFNRNMGRKIALQRAIKDLPKDQRKLIWSAYHEKRGKY